MDASRPEGRYCSTCALARVCLPGDLESRDLNRVETVVQRRKHLEPGQYLFRIGEPFTLLAAVHSGGVKSTVFDAEGREHVQNFYMSGEIVGFEAIYLSRYVADTVALVPTIACILPFAEMLRAIQDLPQLTLRAFQMAGRTALYTGWLTGDHNAVLRMAAFLISMSSRAESLGQSPLQLDLFMSREDIANHLRLAPETVSRILTQMQADGLIAVDRRKVTLLNRAALRDMVPVIPGVLKPRAPAKT